MYKLYILSTIPFLFASQCLEAALSFALETGFDTRDSVKAIVDYIPRGEIFRDPGGIGNIPDWETDFWMELDITSSESAHIATRVSWEQEISSCVTVTTSAGLEFATSDATLHAQTWMYFLNYNPFHPGSRLQSNGAGSVDLDSRSITPHLLVELRWHVSDHIGVGIDTGMGYTFEHYESFDFYSPTNQVFPGVDVIEGIDYTDGYEAFRWQVGVSVSYALSDQWRLSLGYQFLFKDGITLENTVLDDEGDQYIYFLPLRDRQSQRMTLASSYRF